MSSSSAASSASYAPPRSSQSQFPPLSGQLGGGGSSQVLIRPGTRDSLYERLVWLHQHDEDSQRELNMGKRIGFYKLKSELGTGNFSKVKLATHQLTKGRKERKETEQNKNTHYS